MRVVCVKICLLAVLFTLPVKVFSATLSSLEKNDSASVFDLKLSGNDSMSFSWYGYADFFAIYTNMHEAYDDYAYDDKNITFNPYPVPGGVNGSSEQPLFFLVLEGYHTDHYKFNLQVSILHPFNGVQTPFNKQFLFRQPPALSVSKYTSKGTFTLTAGNCTGKTYMSPLTLSGLDLETHPFERLPWDWYGKSYEKYEQIYTSYDNPLKVTGLNATQGFLLEGDQVLKRWGFKVFFGRTNFSITPEQVYQRLPASVLAGNLSYKEPGFRVALNHYYHHLLPFASAENTQRSHIHSVYSQMQLSSALDINVEMAYSRFQTLNASGNSLALHGRLDWQPENKNFRAALKFYNIPNQFVSLDNEVLNTNSDFSLSGVPGDHQYNIMLYRNPLQAPDVMSNNRKGLMLETGYRHGKTKFRLQQALSREIRPGSNKLTFFHQTNAFTRSRFTPWLQGSGPQERIGGRYRFTTETIPFESQKPLMFYSAGLNMQYQTTVNQQKLMLMLTPGFRNAADNLFSSGSFSTCLVDISAYQQVLDAVTMLGLLSFQNNTVNQSMVAIRQRSWLMGVGVDVDIATNAHIHLRYKWFDHRDVLNREDHFRGEEITTELKIFF